MGQGLSPKEKEYIWETFKVRDTIEDNSDSVDERVVNLQALISSKKSNRLKKINEIIQMEEEEEQMAEDIKSKGLVQVYEDYVIKMALNKKANWGGIWKSIK